MGSTEIPDEEAWDAWHPDELAERLVAIDRPWCVVGGWALDLWYGRVTREHHDLEFTVLREDFSRFRRVLLDGNKDPLWPAGHLPHKGGEDSRHPPASTGALAERPAEPLPLVGGRGGDLPSKSEGIQPADLTFYTVNSGVFERLPNDADPDPCIGQTWCWDIAAQRWRVDVMIEPGTPDIWICKRDHAITRPRSEMVRHTPAGIPYLGPGAILLLKAKHQRPKDEADFELALPKLDEKERTWLRASLAKLHPGHGWIERL